MSIGSAVITNLGHPETGFHPHDDDLRQYRYDLMMLGEHVENCPGGHVTHHRNKGAWELVRLVLEDCKDKLPEYSL